VGGGGGEGGGGGGFGGAWFLTKRSLAGTGTGGRATKGLLSRGAEALKEEKEETASTTAQGGEGTS